MTHKFATLDVFTATALAGNPVAVVLDADDLDDGKMQAIAREFNLPETVFVRRAQEPGLRADLRIFSAVRELPFATHPTLGVAGCLALHDLGRKTGRTTLALKERIGTLNCIVEVIKPEEAYARLDVPRLPGPCGEGVSAVACANALSIGPEEIGFGEHRPSRLAASMTYDLIPVASLDALARAKPAEGSFETSFGNSDHPAAFLYTPKLGEALTFRARMFWPGPAGNIAEDPATASAATALVGTLMRTERMIDGQHRITVEQGHEMGRPSTIVISFWIRDGALVSLEVGGSVVLVSCGELMV